MKLIGPFGILESARTGIISLRTGIIQGTRIRALTIWIIGLMALPRSPLQTRAEDIEVKDAGDVVDASALPPG